MKKGQSAIEYLTTYGWMLLVVAIVGGAIFTTLQNSSQIQSVSGLANADVQVDDYGLNNDGLQLSLRASSQDQVNIRKVSVIDSENGVSADLDPSRVVAVGDTAQVNLRGVQSTGTSDTYDMSITYDTGGLQGLKAEGRITGNMGVFNRLSLENANFNRSTNELQIKVRNVGDNSTESINYTIKSNSTEYAGTLSNLNPREETWINVSVDETYTLESVNLETEGTRFVDSSSNLEGVPTKDMFLHWTMDREDTEEGILYDQSGHEVHGTLGYDFSMVDSRLDRDLT